MSDKPIYPHDYEENEWRPVPGLKGYEVSSRCQVRRETTVILLESMIDGPDSIVMIDGCLYSAGNLMMLAFVGPQPMGYIRKRRDPDDDSEWLPNMYYEPYRA